MRDASESSFHWLESLRKRNHNATFLIAIKLLWYSIEMKDYKGIDYYGLFLVIQVFQWNEIEREKNHMRRRLGTWKYWFQFEYSQFTIHSVNIDLRIHLNEHTKTHTQKRQASLADYKLLSVNRLVIFS